MLPKRCAPGRPGHAGFTLAETLVVVVITALIALAISNVVRVTVASREQASVRNRLNEDARFALERMTRAVSGGQRLLLPQADRPATVGINESVRDPGVLATTLDPFTDRDRDGVADADNDGDGLVNEDPGGDLTNDLAAGIFGLDDDADGNVDEEHGGSEPFGEDDDEDGNANEDGWTGLDDDGDGLLDEDPKKDMNHDTLPGIGGVDDDSDGSTDEGDTNDDDEDGAVDEDWLDPVVFYQDGADLVERVPVGWDVNASGSVDGRDFTERTIASGVAQFRVERRPAPEGGPPLVAITLTLADASGESLSLNTIVRAGGGP